MEVDEESGEGAILVCSGTGMYVRLCVMYPFYLTVMKLTVLNTYFFLLCLSCLCYLEKVLVASSVKVYVSYICRYLHTYMVDTGQGLQGYKQEQGTFD